MNKIVIYIFLFLGFGFNSVYANNYLDDMRNANDSNYDIRISSNSKNGEAISNLAIDIAEGVKNVFITLSVVFFLIIAIRLIFSNNTEEEIGNFKKNFIWISIGVVIVNLATSFVQNIYNYDYISKNSKKMDLSFISKSLVENVLNPLIELLKYSASFLFVFIAIFAFFRLVTANGDDQRVQNGRMSIYYAVIGFIIIKISSSLVFSVYGECKNTGGAIASGFGQICQRKADLSGGLDIIVSVINWLNSFVALVVIIMVIFSGVQMIFSNGDEEKYSKFKKSIIYIVIGIAILLFDYFILTFILNNNL